MLKKTWVYDPKPVKLEKSDREILLKHVHEYINVTYKLKKAVKRIDIRAGRIYLYYFVEQFGWNDPDRVFFKPLIDGKYAELPFARITIFDSRYNDCSTDWHRHNDQWISIHQGTLEDCLKFIEDDNSLFYASEC